jgi:hypothetical protein
MIALNNVRALRALNMRRQGLRLIDIAAELGVTKERARQLALCGAEIERRMFSTDPWDELGARTRNALTSGGCPPTPAGVLRFQAEVNLARVPALGRKSIAELHTWLQRHWDQATCG